MFLIFICFAIVYKHMYRRQHNSEPYISMRGRIRIQDLLFLASIPRFTSYQRDKVLLMAHLRTRFSSTLVLRWTMAPILSRQHKMTPKMTNLVVVSKRLCRLKNGVSVAWSWVAGLTSMRN